MALNLQNVNLRISAGNSKQFPTDAIPQIALSGRSNVGKSSLINNLLNRKSLARVSSSPGKTITINFYDIDKKLFLVDLPGYGFAKRTFSDKQQWSSLTDGYFTENKNIDLLAAVVQLIDSRAGITKDDEMMIEFMNSAQLPYMIVVTKMDKLNATERKANLEAISNHPAIAEGTPIVPYSSLKNEGRNELWREISKFADIKL
ncbi:MAG: YihA family ribosome biogenesis GTP-binding protein [Clostridia bacterium]|nr:YihA family ribosome biogenesis GTP-binding protein [Clostridia bacterium]